MARSHAEQEAFEEGQRAGATAEQITTLFNRLSTIEETQRQIVIKLDALNSFKAWAMGAAGAISFVVSTGYHFIKELFK